MADKQIEIEVVAKTDTSEVEALEEVIDQLKSDASEEISLSVSTDELESDLSDASGSVEDLESELEAVNDTVVAPQVDTSGIDELTQKTEESASALDSATTALVGIGATAGLEDMIATADRVNTSWNQLELTFKGTGVTVEDLKPTISSLTETTGRSGTQIRDFFNQMGLAGITNTELLAQSFESMAGRAYQTGTSIESVEGAVQRMVLTGNAGANVLRRLGITSEELGQAMGVSADEASKAFKALSETERLEVLNQVMGEGTEANEMYKDSYAGLKSQADIALGGLKNAIGQSILPVVIPAVEAATTVIKALSDGFKALPGPVQSIIGGVAGFAAIAITLIGVLGTVGQVVGMVRGGLEALNLVTKLSSIYTSAAAAAEWLLTAAQTALNIVMSLNPIVLVVVALVALVAALIWAYQNVDWFREMVDNAWASIVQFAEQIWGALQPAIQFLGDLFNQFTSQLGLNTNDWIQAILGFILFIPTLPAQLAIYLLNALAQTLGFSGNFVQTMLNTAVRSVTGFITYIASLPGRLGTYLSNMLSRVTSWGGSIASNFLSAASKSVSNFANQISQIPARLGTELSNALNKVNEWAATLPQKFWDAGVNAVKNFLDALGIHSPGTMQRMLVWEVSEMARRVPIEGKSLVSNVSTLGSDIVSGFNPDLSTSFETANSSLVNGSTGGVGGQVNNFYFSDIVVDNDERMERIVDYVRREIAWNNVTAGRTV